MREVDISTVELFRAALAEHGGNVAAACSALGRSRAWAYNRPELRAVIFERRAEPPLRPLVAMLKRAREATGIDQGEMAARLGVDRTHVARLESQANAPLINEGHIASYREALGMPLGEILRYADPEMG